MKKRAVRLENLTAFLLFIPLPVQKRLRAGRSVDSENHQKEALHAGTRKRCSAIFQQEQLRRARAR